MLAHVLKQKPDAPSPEPVKTPTMAELWEPGFAFGLERDYAREPKGNGKGGRQFASTSGAESDVSAGVSTAELGLPKEADSMSKIASQLVSDPDQLFFESAVALVHLQA
jgi:hypothetical protein